MKGMRCSVAALAAALAAVVMSVGPPVNDLRAEESAIDEPANSVAFTPLDSIGNPAASIAMHEVVATSAVRKAASKVEVGTDLRVPPTTKNDSLVATKQGLPRGDPFVSLTTEHTASRSHATIDGSPYLPRGQPAGGAPLESAMNNTQYGRC